MSSAPLVSIVIPAWNALPHLRAAIDSVLEQSHEPLELIVVDDGSTDATPALLDEYRGRLRVIAQSNEGQAAALNRGWTESRGEFLGYLSADDLLKPNAIAQSTTVLLGREDAAVVYCDYALIDSRSRVLRTVCTPEFDYRALVRDFVVAPGPGALFRRKAWERAGGWNPRYRQMPDYDFWLRMGLQGTFLRIPEVLAAFRVHSSSITYSRTDRDRADEPITIIDRFYEDPPASVAADAPRARSGARVVAARAHLRDGRWRDGVRRLREAWALSPGGVLNTRSMRLLLSALVGRIRYTGPWSMLRASRTRW